MFWLILPLVGAITMKAGVSRHMVEVDCWEDPYFENEEGYCDCDVRDGEEICEFRPAMQCETEIDCWREEDYRRR